MKIVQQRSWRLAENYGEPAMVLEDVTKQILALSPPQGLNTLITFVENVEYLVSDAQRVGLKSGLSNLVTINHIIKKLPKESVREFTKKTAAYNTTTMDAKLDFVLNFLRSEKRRARDMINYSFTTADEAKSTGNFKKHKSHTLTCLVGEGESEQEITEHYVFPEYYHALYGNSVTDTLEDEAIERPTGSAIKDANPSWAAKKKRDKKPFV
ncbi:MAG TPA: hypothetical protein EYO76_04655, partial [Flavobacteriaceae bacterium]|nr:hypothetical protein [Flavobacteriaceae bacterium]